MQLGDIVDEVLDVLMGFRKFIAFLLVFGVGVVFRCKGYIDGAQLEDLLKNTFAVFAGANSVEHFTSMVKDHIASKNVDIAGKVKELLGKKEDV